MTGLVVNHKTNVPIDYVRSLDNHLYIWRKYGETHAAAALARHESPRNRPPAKGEVEFKALLRGRVQYVGSVRGWSNPRYERLASALRDVDPDFRPRTLVSLSVAQTVRIYTEGAWHSPTQKDSEEERRLLYVGVTRPRKNLHLYVPLCYYHQPSGRTDTHGLGTTSRFLTPELQQHCQHTGPIDQQVESAQPELAASITVSVDELWT